jgi:hypothetical protein
MYVALRDAPLLKLIFQRGEELGAFNVEEFSFILVQDQEDLDIFTYRVSSGVHFSELLFFSGSTSLEIAGLAPTWILYISCGNISNVSISGNTH